MPFPCSYLSTRQSCVTTGLLFFIAVLSSACAQAQEATFLISRSKDARYAEVWLASCPNFKASSNEVQKLSCTLSRSKCKPGDNEKHCRFLNTPAIQQAPLPLVFGVDTWNPTCVWVFDPMRYEYTAYCWD